MTTKAADGGGRLLIVESVTKKGTAPGPAKDVYDSRLWKARRRYAEESGVPWLILSARHGLLASDDTIEPYELRLGDLDGNALEAIADRVIRQLRSNWPPNGRVVEAHVRHEYGDRIAPVVIACGGRLEQPLRGLSVCGQLSWYRGQRPAAAERAACAGRAPRRCSR